MHAHTHLHWHAYAMHPPDAVRLARPCELCGAALLSLHSYRCPRVRSAKGKLAWCTAQVHENSAAIRSELPPLDISLRQFVELVVRIAHVQCA